MKVIHVLLVAVVLLLGGAECRRSNHAPVVSGPPVGVGIAIQDTSYLFEVAASDENGDRVCCRIDWGDGDTSAWSNLVPSDSPVSFAHSWDSAGAFETRNQARDVQGAMSAWSDPAVVAVRDSHPQLWHVSSYQGFCNPLVLSDGVEDVIYECEEGGVWVYAFNGDGSVRYVGHSVDTLNGDGFSTSPVYCAATDHIIIGNYEGELYAFTRDLRIAWHWPGNSNGQNFDHLDWGTPVVRGNRIYSVRDDGWGSYRYVCCFQDLGEQVALAGLDSLAPDDETDQPPAIDADGNIIVASYEGYVYKFAPDLNSLLWRTYVSDDLLTSPVIGSDGAIYCSASGAEGLYVLDPDGSLGWTADVECPGQPVIGESLLFIGGDPSTVYAFSLADGEKVWSASFGVGPDFLATPVLLSNGVVCFLEDNDDDLYGIRQSDGALLWKTKCGPDSWTRRGRDLEESYGGPGLARNGDIVVPTSWGLVRVQGYAGTTLAATPWPKWQHDLYNSGWAGQP